MAYLYYGTETLPIEVPDRILAHLKVVIATKLRRNESFMLTWAHPGEPGVTTIWLQPSIQLRFVFDAEHHSALSGEYLRELANGANSSGGLVLRWDEDGDPESVDAPGEAVAA